MQPNMHIHASHKEGQITTTMLEFSPLERKIYDSLYTDAKKDFENLNAKGLVSRNYTHILAMLMRLVLRAHDFRHVTDASPSGCDVLSFIRT